MKEKILAKSAEMFLNLGVKSVTMDEIAAEMGISKKTIYAHFSTKTKLIEATALHVFENISGGIEKIREDKKNPIEEMYAIKNFACQHLRDERSSPQHQLQKYYPKVFATIKSKQQNLMENQIKTNLQRGIAQGIYHPNLPIDFTSRIYFLGMLGIKDRDLFPESHYTTAELIEKHLEYHLRAIVTPKGLTILNQLLKQNS
ncbi:TetR/AcrR family transcriptional regulator [Salinimicrobium soli]|uniref:TetR/AcrR family transcriptional regulator n=1 Tax=Salinimicrobium soli TaxID=1254399 RepID=UPI003AACF792